MDYCFSIYIFALNKLWIFHIIKMPQNKLNIYIKDDDKNIIYLDKKKNKCKIIWDRNIFQIFLLNL